MRSASALLARAVRVGIREGRLPDAHCTDRPASSRRAGVRTTSTMQRFRLQWSPGQTQSKLPCPSLLLFAGPAPKVLPCGRPEGNSNSIRIADRLLTARCIFGSISISIDNLLQFSSENVVFTSGISGCVSRDRSCEGIAEEKEYR